MHEAYRILRFALGLSGKCGYPPRPRGDATSGRKNCLSAQSLVMMSMLSSMSLPEEGSSGLSMSMG